MSTCTIYGLFDPAVPDVIRYIGRTQQPDKRRSNHRGCGVGVWRQPSRLREWKTELCRLGRKVEMKILEVCAVECSPRRENYWIEQCRKAWIDQGRQKEGQILNSRSNSVWPLDFECSAALEVRAQV